MLQIFFLKEIYGLRREMKDLIRTKVTANEVQVTQVRWAILMNFREWEKT